MADRNFAESDSGAVTVDWVVLTAALVIIGGLVISVIRSGVVDTSEAINETLVAAATSLRGLDGGGTGTPGGTGTGDVLSIWDDYVAATGSEAAAFSAIAENNPDGFYFSGMTDSDGTPIYTNEDPGGGTPVTYSINGETVLASDYSGSPIIQHGPY